MNWQDLGTAIALMLILEGISPFLMPERFRNLAVFVQQTDDKTLRIIAFVSMSSGLALLYWIRSS